MSETFQPESPEAMRALSKAVVKNEADLGVLFDADCDRAAIVDQNGLQANGKVVDRFNTNPLPEKWTAFGWHVIEIDGHDMGQIVDALDAADGVKGQPTVIIAHTVKGKGLSFAENQVKFHNGTLTEETYQQALSELA